MKLVHQCDFCSKTGTEEQIREHERVCDFNPEKKLCWTCENRYDEGAPISGFWNACKKGLNCSDVEDEGEPCKLWEPEKE